MRAAILTAVDELLELEEITPRATGARDVLVHVDASGVCHADLSIATGSEAGEVIRTVIV